jgi:hypothetical protein
MTLAITHTFVSAIADDAAASAAGEVLPSHWNAVLSTSMATAKVLGRATAGTGAVEELATTGSGSVVLATTPTLVTPILGVPTSGTLTNCTGLPAAGVVGTAAILGANTFTDTQTIALGSLSADKNALSITATWGNAATYTGAIKANVTDTSSNAASLLMDLQVGGTSKFKVVKDGTFNCAQPDTTVCSVIGSAGIRTTSTNFVFVNTTNNAYAGIAAGEVHAASIVGMSSTLYKFSNGFSPPISPTVSGILQFPNTTIGVQCTNAANTDYAALTALVLAQSPAAANGAFLRIKGLTELTTIAAAATTDTTIQMPAGAIILAVSVRVTTVIPDATTFTVGDSGLATRFSTAAVDVAANSTNAGTAAGAYYNAGALSVRLTMIGTPPAANTGRVRVTIHYVEITPPTS